MPISSVNFGRWLERLGFKLAEQPIFHQSVQPVSLVADHRMLVSPALGPSGIFGSDIASVALACSTLQIFGGTGAWLRPLFASPSVGQVFITIGNTLASKPVLVAPVTIPPQVFRGPISLACQRGESPNVPSQDVPCYRVGAAGQTQSVLPWIFLPPGGFMHLQHNAVASALEIAVHFYEVPSENAQ